MGKAAAAAAMREKLNEALAQYAVVINETLALEVLDQTAASSVTKVNWNDVVQMADKVSWQATVAGLLWTGERPEVKEVEENMATYFNTLQGFLLLSHGSKVGAGPTLSSSINASVKQIVDYSFMLYKRSIAVYGSNNEDRKNIISQEAGKVRDACAALKKTPSTNITAVGRAMTKVAVSIKDVLREMNELKPANSIEETPLESEMKSRDSVDSFEADLGDDLSPEEMKIAQLAIEVVSSLLMLAKGLIRAITGLLKLENQNLGNDFVDHLERLLILTQGLGAQVDELGACLYPPQEFSTMKIVVGKILGIINEMKAELADMNIDGHALLEICSSLNCLLRRFDSELDCSSVKELVPEMERLNVIN